MTPRSNWRYGCERLRSSSQRRDIHRMPCCGITIEYIYARLKAAEIPGSGTADKLLDELLPVEDRLDVEPDRAGTSVRPQQKKDSGTTAT